MPRLIISIMFASVMAFVWMMLALLVVYRNDLKLHEGHHWMGVVWLVGVTIIITGLYAIYLRRQINRHKNSEWK